MRISDISELNMDFTLSYFIQITSRDDRIRFRSENYENISDIILYLEQIHAIWRPDIIPNVSYVKAIDICMLVCLFHSVPFCFLLE